jgi:uncharacterized surface protein with fasciclin (FAS1) repeats
VSAPSIIPAAEQAGYRTFAAALRSGPYADTLAGAGPFTVFAPNDAAFAKFSPSALDQLLDGESEIAHAVLGYHFARGKVMAARFAGKRIRAAMHVGGDAIIDGASGLRVNSARVVEPDLTASNGVIHGIDAVLWPREPERSAP